MGGAAYGKSQEHHNHVVEAAACSLGQACGLATLFQQIAKEEHSQQRQTAGHDEGGEQQADDGEEYLLALTHLSGWLHLDDTLVLRGEQSHQRGLDDRYQCHIGIGAHGDGSHEVRTEFARQEDGCRAVGSSDDGDACCLVGLEA